MALDRQLVFDTVWNHLKAQGKSSMQDHTVCAYRAPDGSKCAVGALIQDDRYDPDFEGSDVYVNKDVARAIDPKFGVPAIDEDGFSDDEDFLGSLQACHDKHSEETRPGSWWSFVSSDLREVAEAWNLTVPQETTDA